MFNVTLGKQYAVLNFAVACRETPVNLGRRRTARDEAMACGTLAQSGGEQAAEGQTARLSLAWPPSCDLRSLLNLCVEKRAMLDQPRKRRRQTRKRLKHQWPDFATLLTSCNQKPNARGKPHRSAKRAGYPQAELVGVGLTEKLGWGEKERPTRTNRPCLGGE